MKTMRFRELVPPVYQCGLIGIQSQGVGLHWLPGDYAVNPAATDWMAANWGSVIGVIGTGLTVLGLYLSFKGWKRKRMPGCSNRLRNRLKRSFVNISR